MCHRHSWAPGTVSHSYVDAVGWATEDLSSVARSSSLSVCLSFSSSRPSHLRPSTRAQGCVNWPLRSTQWGPPAQPPALWVPAGAPGPGTVEQGPPPACWAWPGGGGWGSAHGHCHCRLGGAHGGLAQGGSPQVPPGWRENKSHDLEAASTRLSP